MKTESTVKYVLRLAAILLAITSVVAALLAGVNSVTAPVIDKLNEEKTQKAIEAVLPGGGVSVDFPATETVSVVYKGEAGYAVQVAPAGFDGAIDMMVGIGTDGTVTGVSVISHSETASLGAECTREDWRAQFVGAQGELKVTKDGGTIDALTGATVTSRAVTEAVQIALDFVKEAEA